MTHTVPLSGRLWTIALCTRFVVSCSRSACEPTVGVDVAGGLDGEAALLGEREQRLGGLLRDERQVDAFAGERALVGAAEQQQRLGEVDRPGVDGVEALDELAGVAVGIVAGDVEQRLRDRQRGAQLVGGVGGEPLLFGDVRLEPREHGVEGVGELAELVLRPSSSIRWESDPFAARRVASVMRVSGASIRPASSQPPTRPNTSRNASTTAAAGAKARSRSAWFADRPAKDHARGARRATSGEVPRRREQHRAGEHQEAGVAERELEADAQARGLYHAASSARRCVSMR